MDPPITVGIADVVLKVLQEDRDSARLSNKRHLTSMKSGISMDSTPSFNKVPRRTGLTSQELNTILSQTSTALRTRRGREASTQISTSATRRQVKLGLRKRNNNSRTRRRGGTLKTPTLGSGTKTTARNSLRERPAKTTLIKGREMTGRRAWARTSKLTTNNTSRSLRELGALLSSIARNFSSSRITDTK